jgi:hypothetical protein
MIFGLPPMDFVSLKGVEIFDHQMNRVPVLDGYKHKIKGLKCNKLILTTWDYGKPENQTYLRVKGGNLTN